MNGPELQSEARRGLRFAQEDLRVAERLLASPDSVPRHVCWFAQQAAEKSLKAGLVLEGIEFPFRHDLDGLRNLLPPGWSVKEAYPDLGELTAWAVEARYPGGSGRRPPGKTPAVRRAWQGPSTNASSGTSNGAG